MAEYLHDDVDGLARAIATDRDDVVAAMDERADSEGFPTVGPAMGAWLRLLARAVDAERVFEFGSGYGYSAYWMAEALPADGEVVLTEIDEDELADAKENLAAGGYADLARFEHGDAIEIVEAYDGPFDVVLIDCQKERYREAFAAVRSKVTSGGVVVADNAVAGGSIDVADVRALLSGEMIDTDEMSQGITDYLGTLRDDPAFETSLLPLGEGAAVSLRVE